MSLHSEICYAKVAADSTVMRTGMGFVPDVGENIKENMEVQQNLPNFCQQIQAQHRHPLVVGNKRGLL